MKDERGTPGRGTGSAPRPTARDVPFTRGAGSESEPAPRGQRPGELPRDPTYEAELAQVDLAVLRDAVVRDDPSTKQGGRRDRPPSQAPASITPESPGARVGLGTSPNPGRAPLAGSTGVVASGTLLSVGAVDPRGRTERSLETPRLFFSQPHEVGEAYFKPGRIPQVTVHQTLETETVKLADSVDPRRAKTLPRIDRRALPMPSEPDEPQDELQEASAPAVHSEPAASSAAAAAEAEAPRPWNEQDEASSWQRGGDAQIHASLSPFLSQGERSFSLDEALTRPEPFAARRASEPPESPLAPPDAHAVPTHRDLPAHRAEASRPPPPPSPPPTSGWGPEPSGLEQAESAGPLPTTASIVLEQRPRSSVWVNLATFGGVLLVTVLLSVWFARSAPSPEAAPSPPKPPPVEPALTAHGHVELAPAEPSPSPPTAAPASPKLAPPPSGEPAAARTRPPAPAAPLRKSAPPKPRRETIF